MINEFIRMHNKYNTTRNQKIRLTVFILQMAPKLTESSTTHGTHFVRTYSTQFVDNGKLLIRFQLHPSVLGRSSKLIALTCDFKVGHKLKSTGVRSGPNKWKPRLNIQYFLNWFLRSNFSDTTELKNEIIEISFLFQSQK